MRIVHALSVQRLTTDEITRPLGVTPEQLRDEADKLKHEAERVTKMAADTDAAAAVGDVAVPPDALAERSAELRMIAEELHAGAATYRAEADRIEREGGES